MLGFAGWLAGIFLLAFVGMALDLKSSSSFLVAGLVLCGAAWALYYADRNAVFLDQLALALSIAGQCAIAWGLLEDVRLRSDHLRDAAGAAARRAARHA